jgi:hypothetical protein
MSTYRVRANPILFTAVQWRGDNEQEIRLFVQDDSMLRFTDGGIVKVWNQMDTCWVDCPVWHYIMMDTRKNLMPISPECFHSDYKEISEDKEKLEKVEAHLVEKIKEIDD